MDKYNSIYEQNKLSSSRYDEVWKSMQDISKAIIDINHNKDLINSYITSLEGLERDRSSIDHTIKNLQEYKLELKAYTEKYEKRDKCRLVKVQIDLLKKLMIY